MSSQKFPDWEKFDALPAEEKHKWIGIFRFLQFFKSYSSLGLLKMTGTEKKTEKSKLTEDVEAKINDITMEGGKVIKMEVDYSETVAKKIPEAREVAKKNLTEALDMLMSLEKQTRTGADMHSTAKVLVYCVSFLKNSTCKKISWKCIIYVVSTIV